MHFRNIISPTLWPLSLLNSFSAVILSSNLFQLYSITVTLQCSTWQTHEYSYLIKIGFNVQLKFHSSVALNTFQGFNIYVCLMAIALYSSYIEHFYHHRKFHWLVLLQTLHSVTTILPHAQLHALCFYQRLVYFQLTLCFITTSKYFNSISYSNSSISKLLNLRNTLYFKKFLRVPESFSLCCCLLFFVVT